MKIFLENPLLPNEELETCRIERERKSALGGTQLDSWGLRRKPLSEILGDGDHDAAGGGAVSTLAGKGGEEGFADGPAASALFFYPRGVVVCAAAAAAVAAVATAVGA